MAIRILGFVFLAMGLLLGVGMIAAAIKGPSLGNQTAQATSSTKSKADAINADAKRTSAVVKTNLPFPESADFRNVMAMHPKGFKDGWVFCGEVRYVSRAYRDMGYIPFLATGETVVFAPEGSISEKTFNDFCLNADPLTPVDF